MSKATGSSARQIVPFVVALFFAWGFATVLNDTLIPKLKGLFELSYAEVMLTQFCFFLGYLFFSIPAGLLLSRVGYVWGIIVGLLVMGLGYLLFVPAALARRLSRIPGRTLHCRGRYYDPAGRRQSAHRALGTAGRIAQPSQSRAGVQFDRHDHRALHRRGAHPVDGRRHSCGREALACHACRVSQDRSVCVAMALSCFRRVARSAGRYLLVPAARKPAVGQPGRDAERHALRCSKTRASLSACCRSSSMSAPKCRSAV